MSQMYLIYTTILTKYSILTNKDKYAY